MKNYKEIVNRIEFDYDGDGVDYEIWIDPLTQQRYNVPIKIVRDFLNLEEIV